MYEKFFGLSRKPFSAAPDPSMYVASENAERVVKRLSYAAGENIGGFLLTGPAGCGKTLLLEKLALSAAAAQEFLFVRAGKMDGDAMAAALLRAAGLLGADFEGDLPERNSSLARLAAHLAKRAKSGKKLTIIIDGAEWVDNDGLCVLEMLNDLRRNGTFLATFILAGQDSMATRILSLPGLRDRLALSARVEPLSADGCVQYATERMRTVGGTDGTFADEALSALFIYSKGVPRRVNRVADLALLTAFGLEKRQVDSEVMAAVIEEISQNPV